MKTPTLESRIIGGVGIIGGEGVVLDIVIIINNRGGGWNNKGDGQGWKNNVVGS